MSTLQENRSAVEARIQAACARSGRSPAEVRMIWVSKNHPRAMAVEALALGARYFGENRVQEAQEKFPLPGSPAVPALPGPDGWQGNAKDTLGYELHFIGRLQKNKIRKVLPLATTIHSIDSPELLEAVDRIAGEMGVRRDVFLQVNTSREPAKGGFEPEALLPALAGLPCLPHLRIVGLMTMGPLETASRAPAGPENARACFRELKRLLQAAQTLAASGAPSPLDHASKGPPGNLRNLRDLAWLSMGMSGDFEAAIEEGAHFVRVGTALFGARGSQG